MVRIVEGGEDISNRIGDEAHRRIQFYADGTFESDGKPFGEMRGEYSFDESSGKILLKRDDHERYVSSWIVTFEGYDLVFSGIGRAARFKVYLNSSF